MKRLWLPVLIIFLIIIACEKESGEKLPDINIPVDTNEQQSYVLITNEGLFPTGAGSITMYDRLTKSYINNVFEIANNYPLGNIVQSAVSFENKLFIVVNNANRIQIANDSTFKSIDVIENINLPRYLLPINTNKAYVTCWNDKVAVVDLNNNIVVNSIEAGTGPEKMLKYQDKVFVLNIGGFGNDSTVTVIDCINDVIDTTIFVAKRPSGIVMDKNSKVWIICSGQGWNGYPLPGDSPGHLICIDPDNYTIINDIIFPSHTEHPEKLAINKSKDILYYLCPGGVYKFDINSTILESVPFISYPNMFYGLGYDEVDELIYVSDPLDYVQRGWVYMYDALSGIVVDSLQAGVIPGEFYFN